MRCKKLLQPIIIQVITKVEKIDWQKHNKAVVKWVFERGDAVEKNEIVRFYEQQVGEEILKITIT